MLVYAIIPARSGSKGLPDKNIKQINGIPLIGYSIDFAQKCSLIDRVICSTDSEEYASIAKEYGAEVPFLRSKEAADDNAMEEDILKDLRKNFLTHGIKEPDLVVWLRPTFLFRKVKDVQSCINFLLNNPNYSAARTIVRAENRLYKLENQTLTPDFESFGKSMIRRQDVNHSYKVFSTDVFRFKNNPFDKAFLGSNVYGLITDDLCGLDIDGLLDFQIVKLIIEENLINTNELLQ
jgi:CMP-N,N'-diacetyllegionaminic acid synthase